MKERDRSGIPDSLIHESITPWISAKTVEPVGGKKKGTWFNIIIKELANLVKCS